MVNQLLAGVHMAAACEAITFAKRLDLDINKVFEVNHRVGGQFLDVRNRIRWLA